MISVGIWILSAIEIGVIKNWQKSQSFSKEISQLYVFDHFLDLAVTHSGVYVNTKGVSVTLKTECGGLE